MLIEKLFNIIVTFNEIMFINVMKLCLKFNNDNKESFVYY